MRKILIILLVFLFNLPVSAEESSYDNIIKTQVHNIHKTKQKILSAATKENANVEEKALLLAIASIETENFSNDYPAGDGKTGDAYNVSIYKMNVGMIKDIDKSVNPLELQNNVERATQIALYGIRKFGISKFLTYHRGGAGAFNGKVSEENIKPYIEAVKKISEKYLEDPKQLEPETTNDTRYTVMVPAI